MGDSARRRRLPSPDAHRSWRRRATNLDKIFFPGPGLTWHARITDVERPDNMLIDLDPSEGNPWDLVPRIALVVKEVLDELDLPSFPKTSGATGFHILTPIRPELRFPEVRRFAKALAQEVERRIGDQDVATTTWKVADRRGVFVDFGQNARDRTIASAYSIRPTPDARASAWSPRYALKRDPSLSDPSDRSGRGGGLEEATSRGPRLAVVRSVAPHGSAVHVQPGRGVQHRSLLPARGRGRTVRRRLAVAASP
jgi:LigD, primase-polymerase domain